MFTGKNELARDDFVAQNIAFVINVAQKKIERRDPLAEAALDRVPFVALDDPRDQIVRKDLFGPFFLPVDGKRDPLVEKRLVGRLLALEAL
jgi:hypothetical protein